MTEKAFERFVKAIVCIYWKRRLCKSMDKIDRGIIQLIIFKVIIPDYVNGKETDINSICKTDILRFSTFPGCLSSIYYSDSDSERAQYRNQHFWTKDINDRTWCRNCMLKCERVFCEEKQKWKFVRGHCARCGQVFCSRKCFKRAWKFRNHKLNCLQHM